MSSILTNLCFTCIGTGAKSVSEIMASSMLTSFFQSFIFTPPKQTVKSETPIYKINNTIPYTVAGFEAKDLDPKGPVERRLLIKVLFCHATGTDIQNISSRLTMLAQILAHEGKREFGIETVRVLVCAPEYPGYPLYPVKKAQDINLVDIQSWSGDVSEFFRNMDTDTNVLEIYWGQSIGCGWVTRLLYDAYIAPKEEILGRYLFLQGAFPSLLEVAQNQGFFTRMLVNTFLDAQNELFPVKNILACISDQYTIIIANALNDELFQSTFEKELEGCCNFFLKVNGDHNTMLSSLYILQQLAVYILEKCKLAHMDQLKQRGDFLIQTGTAQEDTEQKLKANESLTSQPSKEITPSQEAQSTTTPFEDLLLD